MEKNSRQIRRVLFGTAVIIAVAVIGLFAINTKRAEADKHIQNQAQIDSLGARPDTALSNQPFLTSAFPSLLKMIGALLFVLVCIYVVLYLLKQTLGKRYSGGGRSDLLEILATLCVAPKKTVSFIRVADRSVLVGITDHQISVLAEFDVTQTAQIIASLPNQGGQDRFTELLKTASQKIKGMGVKRTQTALDT
ncbi:MAG: FliO/MopB family protein [Candidatus Zixiibacteriota bacterium]